jgi:LuxR family transcriptional regulator, maltose regulon positive regulatory protein
MNRPSFFLRTKLLPPRRVPEILPRSRLTDKLQANLNSPVTLVTADAGCGKTTLVAEFIRRQTRKTVWYQLDHTDADPFVFLGYVCHGIKKFAPDFGETILSYLNEATDDLLAHPERAVDLLLNEILESIEQPFILILDDYHHIGQETIVHRLVDRLLQYSSDILHLIITTRDLPPLAITRRRTQNSALIISREDLLFTDEEVSELFRTTLNIELKSAELAEYRARTHGWITALQLIRQITENQIHASTSARMPDLQEMLKQSEKDIFDYFAEEVFAREDDETKDLLLHLSLFDSLPLEVCSALLPNMRCGAVLSELVRKNVFMTVAGERNSGEEYRLHPLFRDFLLRRFRTEKGQSAIAVERIRIAEFFLSKQLWENALPYLLEAEDYRRAAETIAMRGEEWLVVGGIAALKTFAERIPKDVLDEFPRALIYTAEVARIQGETDNATNLLQRAVKLLELSQNDSEAQADALHSLASIARRKGNCTDALFLVEQAEKTVGENSEVRMKCENTRGLCLIAIGEWTAAEHHFRQALELAEKNSNERFVRIVTHNLALPSGLRGDFGESLRWLKRIFRGDQNVAPLPQEAIGHLNVARLHLYRGEFSETEKHLEKSLELCQLYNLKHLRGEIFECYGNFYREKRDFAHAAEFYERARNDYEENGIDPSEREFDEERATLALMRGDTVTAAALLENLLEVRLAKKNEIGWHTVKLNLCRVKAEQRKYDEIIPELEEILGFFHAQNFYYYEASAAITLAGALLAVGKRNEMLPPAQRALDLATRFDYEYWLREEINRHPILFSDLEIIEKLPLDLRSLVQDSGFRIQDSGLKTEALSTQHSALSTSITPVVDLTLKLLGYIEIYRDPSKPFAADAWTTRRAREIFCYIATSRFRRVEKETLIETFWGETDLNVIEKNFHPTISHIRKALNSRQTLKQNFLNYRDGAYQLSGEVSYSIDTEEYEHRIAEAEKAKREGDQEAVEHNVEAAYALYRGEFMTGVFDDWVEERRNYYREQHGRIAKSLLKTAFKKKDWARSLKFAGEILQADPYREDIHFFIMRIYAAQGKRNAAKHQFETLQKLLKDELGVEPAAETKRFYQDLLK